MWRNLNDLQCVEDGRSVSPECTAVCQHGQRVENALGRVQAGKAWHEGG